MKKTGMLKTKLRPPEIARRWGVSCDKILAFIRTGELRATNMVMPNRGQRPRYLIDVEDLKDFERRREVRPPPAPARRRRERLGEATYY